MGETTTVLPVAIAAIALVIVLIEEMRHRRRLRRVASLRRVLDTDPVSAQ